MILDLSIFFSYLMMRKYPDKFQSKQTHNRLVTWDAIT